MGLFRCFSVGISLIALVSNSFAQQMKDADYLPSRQTQPFTESAIFAKPLKPKDPPIPPPSLIEEEKPLPRPKIWSGGLELGLSGADGNSEVLKIRTGMDLKRVTESNIFTMNLTYGYSNQNGVLNENKALLNARDELPFPNSPWSLFASTNMEYDEFRAFDFRVGAYGGVGYQAIKTETAYLQTRTGAGATREIGGPKDRWVPEALLGFDLEYQFTDRQRIISTFDYYPNLENLNRHRIRTRAAYEILVDPSLNLTLRLGIQDRYDSNPGPARRNDIDYFATLLLKF
jgi:hypothetical protein